MDPSSIYRLGMCDALALAAHRLTQLPLALWSGTHFDDVEQEHWSEPVHAVVVDYEQQRWFDVDGWHEGLTPPDNLVFDGIVFGITLEPATPAEVMEVFTTEGVTEEQIEQAQAFILSNNLLDLSTPSPAPKPRASSMFRGR